MPPNEFIFVSDNLVYLPLFTYIFYKRVQTSINFDRLCFYGYIEYA